MEVQDVEVALDQPAAHLRGCDGPERHAGDGAVVAQRDRTSGRRHVGRERRVLVGSDQDAHLVPLGDERLGEVADVELHTARRLERVRAHDPDPQLAAGHVRHGTLGHRSSCVSAGVPSMAAAAAVVRA